MSIARDLLMNRRQFGLAVIAAAAGIAGSRTLGWTATPRERLVVGMSIGVDSLNPYAHSDSPLYGLWGHVMESLVDTDYARKIFSPELATAWSPKGSEWTFQLRRGVTFHDGSPFTAKDVAYSYDRLVKDKQSLQAPNLSDIKEVKAPDDYTLVIVTHRPKVALLSLLYNRVILSQKAAEKLGDKLDERAIGTGPYRFVGWQRGGHFTMRRNEKYWGEAPRVREIVWRPIKEDAARVAAIESGQADIINQVPVHDLERLKRNPRVRVEMLRGLRVLYIGLNPAHKPFDNKLVRQAFNYAVDQEAIIKHVHEDQVYGLKGLLGPQMLGYDEQLENYRYDPEKAKKLLAEAGYPNGISVDFYAHSGRYQKDRETAQAIASQMTKAGIKTEIKTPEYAIYEESFNNGKYGMYMFGRGSITDPEAFYIRYFRSGRGKRLSYKNPEFDRLFDQQSETFDTVKREEMLRQMGRILHDDCPVIPLYNTADVYAVRREVIWKPRPDEKIPVAAARFQS
jgi:peptide/nickel transport system substrate-binding protein